MSKTPASSEQAKIRVLSICALQFSIFTSILPYLLSEDQHASNFYSAFELFDDKKHLKDLIGLVFWTARPIGALLMGWASDRFGRVKTLSFSLTLQSVALFFTMVSFSTRILTCTCFFLGFLAFAGVVECTVLLCECSGSSKNKVVCGVVAWMSFGVTVGSVFWALEVNWRVVVLSNFLLALVSLGCFNLNFQPNEIIFSLGKRVKDGELRDRVGRSGAGLGGLFGNKGRVFMGLVAWSNFEVFEFEVVDKETGIFGGGGLGDGVWAVAGMVCLWVMWEYGEGVKSEYFFAGFALNRAGFLGLTGIVMSDLGRIAGYGLVKCGLCIEMCLVFRLTIEWLPIESRNLGLGVIYVIAKAFRVLNSHLNVFPIFVSIFTSLSMTFFNKYLY